MRTASDLKNVLPIATAIWQNGLLLKRSYGMLLLRRFEESLLIKQSPEEKTL